MDETSLWVAILVRGLLDAFGQHEEIRLEAIEWIMDNSEELGSFVSVCNLTGIDAAAMRDHFEKLTPEDLGGILSEKAHFRRTPTSTAKFSLTPFRPPIAAPPAANPSGI